MANLVRFVAGRGGPRRFSLAAGVLVLLAAPAGASIEDFESWDLGAQEGDDEYGLDSYFLAFSPEWEAAWMEAGEGARSSMGSTVNEVWEMRNELRLRRELNPRLRFVYGFTQNQGLTIDDEQHLLGLEMERGGFWFGPFARPNTSKERLDAGLMVRRVWSMGLEIRASLSFEDWNSDHTNGRSDVRQRTYTDFIDPAREWRFGVRQVWSARRWVSVDAVRLPEFRRRIQPPAFTGEPEIFRFVGGESWSLRGAADPLPGLTFDVLAERKESRVADFPSAGVAPFDMRREAWNVRTRVTHDVAAGFLGRWGLQLRGAEERDAEGPAPVPYRLEVDDVVATVGTRRGILSWLTGELGYGHQKTTIRQDGPDSEQRFTWGTRTENRLYLIAELQTLGLRARFIETIELDNEGYDAISDHDKGFIQIQADF
jgi:hypothetical protein